MKIIKTLNIVITIIGILFFYSCSSTTKTSENTLPFKILEATYSNIKAEQSNINTVLVLIKTNNSTIKLDTLFFRNTRAVMEFNDETSTYISNIELPNTKINLQLDINPKNEFGNQVPNISPKIPFELKQNEAIVSYLYKGENHYHKILNVLKK